jgi:histidine triad (HIT) family protein
VEASCIFCQIVAGQSPASVVYEDDIALAFMDIRPVTPGHLLVIPKQHATYLAEMDEVTGAHLFRIAMRLAPAVRRSGVRCEGINLFLADGEAAGQEIFHVHLHIIPRFVGDGFIVKPEYQADPERDELDVLAQQIRHASL